MSASRIVAVVCAAFPAAVVTGSAAQKTVRKAAARPAVGGSGTSSADVMPFAAVEKTLGNGLKVIVVPTGFPNIASLQIPVQTGSRNEVEPGNAAKAKITPVDEIFAR